MAVQIPCQKKKQTYSLWPSLTGLVTDMMLLAIMYVSYAIIAESYYLLDHKNGAIRNH